MLCATGRRVNHPGGKSRAAASLQVRATPPRIPSMQIHVRTAIFAIGGIACTYAENPTEWAWRQTAASLALVHQNETVWQLNFGPDEPKPNFHPLATPGGRVLTAYEPADHPWHRGLWWAWKYINGVNYWEENRHARTSAGRTTVADSIITPGDDFSARATLTIHYHPPGEPALLSEIRHLAISAPDASGSYHIDWSSTFTAGETPLTLDRTPPASAGGPRHGGYAGLSLRFSTELENLACLTSQGTTTAEAAHARPARWLAYSDASASAAILDHPDNLRHPQPWYAWNTAHMRFFSPSPIFDAPLELQAGESFHLRYRILIQANPANTDAMEKAWDTFRSSE